MPSAAQRDPRLTVRDGRIVEGWTSFDFLTIYQQIESVKNPLLR